MPSRKKKICKRKVINKKQLRSAKGYFNKHSHFIPFNIRLPNMFSKSVRNLSPQPPPYKNAGLSSKEKSFIICSCQTKSSQYTTLKSLALSAIQNQKIFTIYGSCSVLRKALVQRGWVEKIPSYKMNLSKFQNGALSSKPQLNGELERLLLSSLVTRYPSNFIWHSRDEIIKSHCDITKACTTLENKLRADALWTTKQGLCSSMKRNYWFYIEDVSEVTGPRSYNTYDKGEVDDFEKDYKITACTSLLKWVLSMVACERPVFNASGKISLNILVFALNRCKEYLFRKQNRDIDRKLNTVNSTQWDAFFKKYYRLIEGEDIFQSEIDSKVILYLGYAKFLLKEIYRYRPQLSCEGCHNIWIIKPTHNSRGRGIRMASKFRVITDLLHKATSKYVIQKYIEEPLLIHETKFDIRQYYLVTSTFPLVIWMYEDCYLKFSSQKYNLQNYHEAIHLTNNAVQRKYANCAERHSELPTNNMWDLDMYKNYLNSIGKGKVWDNIIYPGMRKSIIGIMLSCQDSLAVSKNRFELYGCDFILDKTYTPWLIEINSGPDLNHTTPVTAKICPAVINDIIKVVVDYPLDENSETGKFECIYHQPMTIPRYGSVDLCVRGYTLPSSYFYRGNIPKPYFCNDDVLDIEKAHSPQAILENIKKYYNSDTIMVDTEDCDSNSIKNNELDDSNYESNTESDYELNVAATVITAQLEELMNRITSSNSDAISVSRTQSITSVDKIETALKKSISRLASLVVVGLKQIKPGKTSRASRYDPVKKYSAIKKIFENYGYTQKGFLKHQKQQTENHKHDSDGPSSKNFILEATSEIVNFISKKEKEYLLDQYKLRV